MISLIYSNENSAKFDWVFTKFLELYIVHPAIILTDSCSKMAKAIKDVFPTTKHLLCVYHISGNFFQHIHGIVGNEWFKINRQFWRLAKETDLRSVDKFDAEFKLLEAAIVAATTSSGHAANNSEIVELALDWLRDVLYNKREQWAYRWTWSSFTVGCHSTQRSESIHAAIKKVLTSSNFSLVQLFTILTRYQSDRDFFGDLKRLRDAQRVHKQLEGPYLDVLRRDVTTYAFTKLQEQYNQAMFYTTSEKRDADGTLLGWDVRRIAVVVPGASSVPSSEEDASASASSIPTAFDLHGDTLVDEGLNSEDGSTARFVTVAGVCSCQNMSTVGITCRHVMCCSMLTQHRDASNNPRFIGVAAAPRYAIDSADILAHQRNLDATRGIRASQSAPTEMTKQERERELHALATLLVSAGKTNVSLTRFVADELTILLQKVREKMPTLETASIPRVAPFAASGSSIGGVQPKASKGPTIANPENLSTKKNGKHKRLKSAHSHAAEAGKKAQTKEKAKERREKKKAEKATATAGK